MNNEESDGSEFSISLWPHGLYKTTGNKTTIVFNIWINKVFNL